MGKNIENNKDSKKANISATGASPGVLGVASTDHFSQNSDFTPLTREQETECFKAIVLGKKVGATTDEIMRAGEAQNTMFNCNTRLVHKIAKSYEKYKGTLDYMDLVQEGMLGLLIAIERFDYTRGNKFSTYASWWIKERILDAINNDSSTIRIPEGVRTDLRRINDARNDFFMTFGKWPTPDEIAKALDWELSPEKINTLLNISANANAKLLGENVESLDGKVTSLDETLPSADEDQLVFKSINEEDNKKIIAEALKTLSPREEFCIIHYYGIDCEPMKRDMIAEALSVSKERVRQILNVSVAKMRKAIENDQN